MLQTNESPLGCHTAMLDKGAEIWYTLWEMDNGKWTFASDDE